MKITQEKTKDCDDYQEQVKIAELKIDDLDDRIIKDNFSHWKVRREVADSFFGIYPKIKNMVERLRKGEREETAE